MRYVPSVLFFIAAILAAILLRSEYEPWVEDQVCCTVGKLFNGTCTDEPVYTKGWITGNRAVVLAGTVVLVIISPNRVVALPDSTMKLRVGAMIGVAVLVFIGTNLVVWRLLAVDCDNPSVSPTIALYATLNPDSIEMTVVLLCGYGWVLVSIPMAIRGMYRPPVTPDDPLKQVLLDTVPPLEPGLDPEEETTA